MAYISGLNRKQLVLFPECLDEYIDENNPIRVIDAFVDQTDIESAGFLRFVPAKEGRPGYDPRDILKLYIYGYLNRVRSSRRLEVERHQTDQAKLPSGVCLGFGLIAKW